MSVVQPFVLANSLLLEGFQNYLYMDRRVEAFEQNMKWVKEGKLKYPLTITEGFDNMPKAFIEMLQGANIGKAVVKAWVQFMIIGN